MIALRVEGIPKYAGPMLIRRHEPYNTERARELRAEQSPPEGVFWSRVRGRRLGGLRFRRQHPIGPIVVDFACPGAMVVVGSFSPVGRRWPGAAGSDEGLRVLLSSLRCSIARAVLNGAWECGEPLTPALSPRGRGRRRHPDFAIRYPAPMPDATPETWDTRDRGRGPPRAVVLLSGGIDSATAAAIAIREGFEVHAISFDYRQRHTVELEAAARVAESLGVAGRLVFPIDLRSIGGSALTDSIEVPKNRDEEAMSSEIPVTYVPARNLIFLSVAIAWAETLGAADLYCGVNAIDYSGYPDCRPEFIDSFNQTANLATRLGVEQESGGVAGGRQAHPCAHAARGHGQGGHRQEGRGTGRRSGPHALVLRPEPRGARVRGVRFVRAAPPRASRTRASPTRRATRWDRITFRAFQQLIRDRYYATDNARGTHATFLLLTEEFGELATALYNNNKEAHGGSPPTAEERANLVEEFADVLAWLTTLANINGVDLEESLGEVLRRDPRAGGEAVSVLRILMCLAAVLAASACPAAQPENAPARRPNVVLIMADDLGLYELGAYGQAKIRTPNLDRIAREGVRFDRFYSASTVCAPSRASLMTGLHTGVSPIRGNKEGGGWGPEEPEGQNPLPAPYVTIAERLKEEGYATAAFGKWGLGGPGSEGHPNFQGFDHWYGYNCQRVAHNYYPTHLWRNHDVDVLHNNDYFRAHQRIDAPLASEAEYARAVQRWRLRARGDHQGGGDVDRLVRGAFR
jgi:queuosine biosynthesis protein QueC